MSRWITLAALASGGVALAALSFVDAYANVLRERAPDSVLRLRPSDPLALAYAADRAIIAAPTDQSVRVSSQRLALRSLEGALLNPVAVRITAGRFEREPRRFIAALDAAQRLTRHDVVTQLLLIEANVAQENVAGALRSYDRILRRRPIMGDTLFPVLAAAARDPVILRPLRAYLAAGAPWSGAFIDWAIDNDNDLATLLPVIVAATPDATGLNQGRKQGLIRRLVALKSYPAAVALYRRFGGRFADGFATTSAFTPLDWEVQNGPGIDGSVDPDAKVFRYTLLGQSRGLLLRRLVPAASGPHRIDLAGRILNGPTTTQLAATATCAQTGAVLATVSLARAGQATGSIFDIPSACPFVWLTLDGATASGETAEGWISRLGLTGAERTRPQAPAGAL